MRIRLNDPDLVADLLRHLQERADVIAGTVGDDELEVSILGSRRRPYNRMELALRLRAWKAAHPDAELEIED